MDASARSCYCSSSTWLLFERRKRRVITLSMWVRMRWNCCRGIRGLASVRLHLLLPGSTSQQVLLLPAAESDADEKHSHMCTAEKDADARQPELRLNGDRRLQQVVLDFLSNGMRACDVVCVCLCS